MILRLIVKKDGSFKTKDISFYWQEDHGGKMYMTDNIPASEFQELLKVEIVGAELILESTDK